MTTKEAIRDETDAAVDSAMEEAVRRGASKIEQAFIHNVYRNFMHTLDDARFDDALPEDVLSAVENMVVNLITVLLLNVIPKNEPNTAVVTAQEMVNVIAAGLSETIPARFDGAMRRDN